MLLLVPSLRYGDQRVISFENHEYVQPGLARSARSIEMEKGKNLHTLEGARAICLLAAAAGCSDSQADGDPLWV